MFDGEVEQAVRLLGRSPLHQRVERERVELEHGDKAGEVDLLAKLKKRQGKVDHRANTLGLTTAMLLGEPLDALVLRRADAQAALDQFGHNGSSLGEAWSGYRKAMFSLLEGLAQAGGLPQVECGLEGHSAGGITIKIYINDLLDESLGIGLLKA